jgi:hypothetical protein
VVITGTRGAGKSVIYRAITGQTGHNYFHTEHTDHVDSFRAKTRFGGKGRRSDFVIIPGQLEQITGDYAFSAERREQTIRNIFSGKHKPKGVIHVVSWGYDWVWKQSSRRALSRDLLTVEGELNLGKLRKQNQSRELAYFREVCSLLKGAWAQRPPGIWLIIAIAKCDLYWPDIDKARRYYLPDGTDSDSSYPFRAGLSELVSTLGIGGLSRLAILPVSSAQTPFDFSKSTNDFDFPIEIFASSSELKENESRALLNNFQATIGEFNAKR